MQEKNLPVLGGVFPGLLFLAPPFVQNGFDRTQALHHLARDLNQYIDVIVVIARRTLPGERPRFILVFVAVVAEVADCILYRLGPSSLVAVPYAADEDAAASAERVRVMLLAPPIELL